MVCTQANKDPVCRHGRSSRTLQGWVDRVISAGWCLPTVLGYAEIGVEGVGGLFRLVGLELSNLWAPVVYVVQA